MKTELTTTAAAMAKLDEIAETSALSSSSKPFSQAIQTAQAMQGIRANLPDAVLREAILPLMNSRLGFRTDKDPSRPVWNRKTSRMEKPEPYSVEVVRECLIEATLRGLPPVGNCFNIISGNAYVTKEGFWHLLRFRVPGLTDFKLSLGVPRMVKPASDAKGASDEDAKGAVVPCGASWKMNGKPDSIEREIPIRINSQMGTDAILGKAERKILAAAFAQITGTTLGDADVADHDAPEEMRDATPSRPSLTSDVEAITAEPIDPTTRPIEVEIAAPEPPSATRAANSSDPDLF